MASEATGRRIPLSYLALAVGVLGVSFSAIFIRLASSPSLVIAANRMLVAVLLLAAPTALTSRQRLERLTRREILALAVSGLFLSVHFGLWTLSLAYTSVASSVVFVSIHPIFVALAEWAWLHERLPPVAWAGICATVAGSAIIGANDLQVGGRALYGDLLAVGGAVAIVGYLLIGRRLRQRLDFLGYSTPVYAVCWAGLVVWAAAGRENVFAFPATDLVWFVALALVPTIGGHTVMNWALAHVPASLVAVAFVCEPVGAALLAWLLLGEAVPVLTALGGGVILAGVVLTSRGA